ncbi:monalysin family beta-barrel pore-forming toxin [Pseudomonas sp. QD4]|uniref:monalysin family beta-barrel pore-forming toxin n=1 Tax=Pseudomonas sp. QD4 TaxID=3368618 RepID=UPI003B9F7823
MTIKEELNQPQSHSIELDDLNSEQGNARAILTSNFAGSFDQFPTKRGGYAIDSYLLDYSAPKQGCWVDGITVYGDIFIGKQNWGTYTRPVFAYLQYMDTISIPQQVTQTRSYQLTKGHTKTFTTSVTAKYSVGGSIGIVNVGSDISVGFSSSESWSTTQTFSESTQLTGPGTFIVYQVVLVYAHNATSAGRQNGNAFAYNKTQTVGSRLDLYYLSAITQNSTVIVESSKAIAPLDWDTVQRNVLMENYNPSSNSGHFSFDWSAYNDPHRRY